MKTELYVKPPEGTPESAIAASAAIEEAGHSFMAAFLRVPFGNVHINNNHQQGQTAGGVSHTLNPARHMDHETRQRSYR